MQTILQNLAFTFFKISMYFKLISQTLKYFKSFILSKCTKHNSCYIVENCHHLQTRIGKHTRTDIKTIFKHIHKHIESINSFNVDYFRF